MGFSSEYRTVDHFLRRALIEAIKQHGKITFNVDVQRDIDPKAIHAFLEYVKESASDERIYNVLEEVLREPSQYLGYKEAGILGVNV